MIKVNKNVKDKWVEEEVNSIIIKIADKAKNGIAQTSVYLDKEIYSDALDLLNRKLDEDGTEYTWKQVAPSYRNMYGGWMYPMSEDLGHQRRRVIKILS